MRRFALAALFSLAAFAADERIVTAKGHTFLAEVAVTEAERARGLMYRQFLDKDRCMIFLFEEDGYHPFWMKNTMIYLDMVWVDADGKVVEIVESAPPLPAIRTGDIPTYGGTKLSRNVIEFKQGTVKRLGLKTGDRVGWDLTLDNGVKVKGGVPVTTKPSKRKSR